MLNLTTDKLLTYRQAAELLGCCYQTVRRYAVEGVLVGDRRIALEVVKIGP